MIPFLGRNIFPFQYNVRPFYKTHRLEHPNRIYYIISQLHCIKSQYNEQNYGIAIPERS